MASGSHPTFHLAVFNIGRPTAPLDSAQLQAFMDGLDPINALAEQAPGFVWRYTADGTNNATAARPFDDDVIVNFGVWQSRERSQTILKCCWQTSPLEISIRSARTNCWGCYVRWSITIR